MNSKKLTSSSATNSLKKLNKVKLILRSNFLKDFRLAHEERKFNKFI